MDKEDVVHTYNGIVLICKKNKVIPFAATWVDLEIIILSKVSQREISYDIACMQNFFKMIQMNLFTKHTDTHRLRKLTYGYGRGAGREKRIVREFGIDMYTLLYLKWITTRTYCIAQGTLLSVM